MTTQKNLREMWESGFVNRWHCNTEPSLRNSGDTNDAHSNRVAKLVLMLTPLMKNDGFFRIIEGDLYSDLKTAVMHDSAETLTGDIPNPSKLICPEVKEAAVGAEDWWWAHMTGQAGPVKSDLVRMCDLLDAILFAKMLAPDLMKRKDWSGDVELCTRQAGALGLAKPVSELLGYR